jgi:mannose-6-phosphate isomerase-like protein (cupin superfamily)
MFHKKISQEKHYIAGDSTLLAEVIHPLHQQNRPNLPYSLAHVLLAPNKQSTLHKLTDSSETYIIVKGKGKIVVNNEKENISKGSIIVVPPNTYQYIHNTGTIDLECYCIVAPPWQKNQDISLTN